MQYLLSKLTLGSIFLVFSALAYAAEPVAMITDIKGNAYLSGQKSSTPLAVLTYLPPGEEIVLESGAQLVVTYFDESAEFSFKGPARIEIQPNLAKVVKGAPAGMRNLDKEKSAGAGKFARSGKLSFAAVEMRSIAVKPTLLSPVNTKISTTTPVFSWKSVNDAPSYTVLLRDDAGNSIFETTVQSSSWQLPADVTLKPGANYQWVVTEIFESGEKLSARSSFSIADPETVSRVFAKRPQTDAAFSDRVTYAIFLESEGFREDAKKLWRELAAQRPDDPNLKFRAR